MGLLRYISHPNVVIDAEIDVPRWPLSEEGIRRATAMATRPWTERIGRILSSDERKAVMTAEILAAARNIDRGDIEIRPTSGEVDRSAVGFVSAERYEELADRLFAYPDVSSDGWETAIAAQSRTIDAFADVLAEIGSDVAVAADRAAAPDIAIVGHGGVGTLLYCHLAGLDIDRIHDQPGIGNYWSFDLSAGTMLHPWRPIDGDT